MNYTIIPNEITNNEFQLSPNKTKLNAFRSMTWLLVPKSRSFAPQEQERDLKTLGMREGH
jgi:hypothetical protein